MFSKVVDILDNTIYTIEQEKEAKLLTLEDTMFNHLINNAL